MIGTSMARNQNAAARTLHQLHSKSQLLYLGHSPSPTRYYGTRIKSMPDDLESGLKIRHRSPCRERREISGRFLFRILIKSVDCEIKQNFY